VTDIEDKCYYNSEALSLYIFAEAVFLKTRLPSQFWSKTFFFRLITSILLIISSNVLTYYPVEVQLYDYQNMPMAFGIWMWCCYARVLSIHTFLKKFSPTYYGVIDSLRRMIPVIYKML
jgi:hypothetical protein